MTSRAALIFAALSVAASPAAAQISTSSRGVVTPAPTPPAEAVQAPEIPATSGVEIAAAFRSELNAIVGVGAARRVLVSRTEPWGRVTRTLKLGDDYRDGWRIASLGTSQVTLSKGDMRQSVDISSRVAAAGAGGPAVETARPVVVAGSLGLLSPPPPPVASPADGQAATPAVDMDLVNALIDQLAILTAAIAPAP